MRSMKFKSESKNEKRDKMFWTEKENTKRDPASTFEYI